MDAKFCMIEKDTNFTHFASKMLYINTYKLVHICTFATITVHICTATVDLVSSILDFSLSFTSLSQLLTLTSLSFCLSLSPPMSPISLTDLTSVHRSFTRKKLQTKSEPCNEANSQSPKQT